MNQDTIRNAFIFLDIRYQDDIDGSFVQPNPGIIEKWLNNEILNDIENKWLDIYKEKCILFSQPDIVDILEKAAIEQEKANALEKEEKATRADHKVNAINKLTALGLSEDEIYAIISR